LNKKAFLIASAFGVALMITLISGVVDTTPPGILGATWNGWPLAWFYVIVYPGSPWSIDWVNFAGDVMLWFAVVFAVFCTALLASRQRKRE
jgi:hypothetical protein